MAAPAHTGSAPTLDGSGSAEIRLWDPAAEEVFLVWNTGASQNYESHRMVKQPEGGVWSLWTSSSPGKEYAFIAVWLQELRCKPGQEVALYGAPHADADLPGSPAVGEPVPAIMAPAAWPRTPPSCAAMRSPFDDEAVAIATKEIEFKRQLSAAERMERAEFLLEVSDLSLVAAEAEGVRINFYVAARVIVDHVEVSAVDGSWGPLALQRAEDADVGAISLWVVDAPEWLSPLSPSEVVVRVRRSDWRIDPYSVVLSRGAAVGAAAPHHVCGGASVKAPLGPMLWSVVTTPPNPPPSYHRCADRELVIYELHIGSFTSEGTISAATSKLRHLRDLGFTAISVMPVQQDARRIRKGQVDMWGYDVLSLMAVDFVLGTPAELAEFIAEAHKCRLAVLVDFVTNHLMWGADSLFGPQYFLSDMETPWGPRPDFSKAEVRSYALAAVEFFLLGLGFDGIRVDSTKSIRKLPDNSPDAAGAGLLGQITSLCRKHGRLAVAEDLQDGDGVLQQGGLGFHLQWDMALFCWVYDALVHPLDEFRDFGPVVRGLQGLAPSRGHTLRGRVIFMESHDTAASDRYGRVPAAVHNGKAFMATGPQEGEGGDAFQQGEEEALPYPAVADVEANAYAARRAALGMVVILTAPGVPMILQGQEAGDASPFKWPNGPRLDWGRVAAQGPALKLCERLIGLRLNKVDGAVPGSVGPLMGDGLHVFHNDGGVLAYLRWAETADSRAVDCGSSLAMVVINCSNNLHESFALGAPPSNAWRLALSTVSSGTGAVLKASQGLPSHNFPCTLNVPLPPYSAVILLKES